MRLKQEWLYRPRDVELRWVGSRAGLDGRKISSPPGIDPGPSSSWLVTILTEAPGPLPIESLKNSGFLPNGI